MNHYSPYSDKVNQKENPVALLLSVLALFTFIFSLAAL